MNDAEWNEHVRQMAIQLSSLFGAIASNQAVNPEIRYMTNKGGRLALELCTEASNRNIAARMEAEVEAAGYDLAALTTAPPSVIEE